MMIPVYIPWITDLEKKYINEAIDSTWISSTGKFINMAEEKFGEIIGNSNVLTANNGTNALHLCCISANVDRDSVVVIPTLTYAASAFAVSYCNAKIEFIDSDPDTWNMDLEMLEDYCVAFSPTHVMAVHLLGNPVDMVKLMELSIKYNFTIIEDACESIGANIYGTHTGNFSIASAFSFYGNKTLAVGEGGIIVTRDQDTLERAKLIRGQAQHPTKRYWHIDIGHNYRMTNIQAAILCAQIERYDEIIAEKERVSDTYHDNFKSDSRIMTQKVLEGHKHGRWMIAIKTPIRAFNLAVELKKLGIDTRPMFYPISTMPPYYNCVDMPVANDLSDKCLMLPSYPLLSDDNIDYICDAIRVVLDQSEES